MATLEIKYVDGHTAAVLINLELYYIKTGPDFPIIYNRHLKKLLIPNIDHWLQAQTQQRYSYRGVKDMMAAFIDGYQFNHQQNDLISIFKEYYKTIIDIIFKTESTKLYAAAYRIELMDSKQLSKTVSELKDNFESYRKKYGDNAFYNYLCRLLRASINNHMNESTIIEGLILRMERKPSEPVYPNVDKEHEIIDKIIYILTNSEAMRAKSITPEIIKNVHCIQQGIME